MIAHLNLAGVASVALATLCFTAITPSTAPVADLAKVAVLEKAPVALTSEVVVEREQQALAEHLAKKYSQPLPLVSRIVSAAYKEAEAHDFSPLLVLAIIEKESSLQPTARSGYDAIGLMQVVPRWHKEKLVGEKHPDGLRNPETNIRVGAKVLAEYLAKRKGNLDHALATYSGGATNYASLVRGFRSKLEAVRNKARTDAYLIAAASSSDNRNDW